MTDLFVATILLLKAANPDPPTSNFSDGGLELHPHQTRQFADHAAAE
jgi:hypothetical protein